MKDWFVNREDKGKVTSQDVFIGLVTWVISCIIMGILVAKFLLS